MFEQLSFIALDALLPGHDKNKQAEKVMRMKYLGIIFKESGLISELENSSFLRAEMTNNFLRRFIYVRMFFTLDLSTYRIRKYEFQQHLTIITDGNILQIDKNRLRLSIVI